MRFGSILFGICFLLHSSLFAQKVYEKVTIQISDQKEFIYSGLDSLSVIQKTNKRLQKLVSQGFLFARATQKEFNDSLVVQINKGKQYDKISIDSVYVSNSFYEVSSLKQLKGEMIGIIKLNRFLENAIQRLNDNGYPFAQIELIPNFKDSKIISANLIVLENALVSFDSVIIFGGLKLSKSFIKHYLGIEKGKPFDESVFRSLKKRLEVLQFIGLEQNPFVLFQKNKARILSFIGETSWVILNLFKPFLKLLTCHT